MKRQLLVALFFIISSSQVVAQPNEAVKRACKGDAQRLCGTVFGQERRACIQQHRAELSGECQAAIAVRQRSSASKVDGGSCEIMMDGKCRSQAWVARATKCHTDVQAQSFPSHVGGAQNKDQYGKAMIRRCMRGVPVYGQ